MFQVKDVRCEYVVNPIGIDVKKPRISWKLTSDKRDVQQVSYQIQIGTDSVFSTILWDSGEVKTEQSLHVVLEEINFVSRKRYYYRVQVTNQHGESTGWSEVNYFEMGLLEHDDWVAEWVSPPVELNGEPCPVLSRDFTINKNIKSARLYATSLGLYELEINGKRVGEDYFTPGWTNYKERLQYQTYDVTDLIEQGDNSLTGLLGNGWYKGNLGWQGKRNIYGDRLALLAQLHIEYQNGEEIVVCTDREWKVSESPIQQSELYHGEVYDARKEDHEKKWKPVEVISYTKDILVAQENVPVRKINVIDALEIIKTPNHEVVIDMGQNMVGWIQFSIEGRPGQQVEIQHAEVLDSDGNFYLANIRSAKQSIRYTCKGEGTETFEPHFTFQGFRYLKLSGFTEEQVVLENFKGIVLHSDMEMTGEFTCSDPIINQLQHNILWGLKGNFLDVPTDCPQRDERLGWTGDAQMFIRTAAYLANIGPFFTKWLHDLKAEQHEDGGVPFVIPDIIAGEKQADFDHQTHSSAAWGDAAVICPWTLYIAYGDTRILEEQYESMKAWISYIYQQGENPYLWNTGFHFGDWLALDSEPDSYIGATDKSYIATAFYAYSTSLVKKTARVLGRDEDAGYFEELEQKIVEAFTAEFVTTDGGLTVPTQTAQLLSLMFNLLEGSAKYHAVEKLMELIKEADWHLTTGFVGTPYLNHVLSEQGHNDTAYKLLFQKDYPSWLYQITKGATTIWEHWDGIKEDGSFWSADMNSFNHYAYGAIGDWLYRKVAGIELDEEVPAYKQFSVRPYIGEGLDWVEARFQSMYGFIRSYWRKEVDGSISMEVSVPVNTTAKIFLPNALEEKVTEGGKELNIVTGIQQVDVEKDGVWVRVGSGNYSFRF